MRSRTTRVFAAVVAVTAWTGLIVQCMVTYGAVGSLTKTLSVVLGYFTITTALLSALVFLGVAAGARAASAAWVVVGVMLAEVLVGVVYTLLLHGLMELSGGSAVANALLHFALPVLAGLFWLLCSRKGELRPVHPVLWAAYPLLYLLFAMWRGAVTGKYPYPFLDLTALGGVRVAMGVAGIAIGFFAVAFGLVALDGLLARYPRASATNS